MARALLVLLLVAGGAVALVLGIDFNRQLEERLSGTVTALVVAISPRHQAAVVFWRLLALTLMIAGPSLLIFGAMVGIGGMPKPAGRKKPDKPQARPKTPR